jgi:hypothetical protein
MSGTESLTVVGWIHQTLTADAALTGVGVYDTVAPADATFPLIIVAEAGDIADTNVLPATRVLTTGTWQVRVAVEGMSWAPAAALVQRIDELLQSGTATLQNGTVLGCSRVAPLKYAEEANGRQYRHLGGLYRVVVR